MYVVVTTGTAPYTIFVLFCFTGVTIGFQFLEYSSNENSVVEVCAIITEGSLQEREVTVRISTEADTATCEC